MIDDNLLETGSILLRGLPITTGEACEAFVDGMGYTRQKYEPYGGVRQKVRPVAGCVVVEVWLRTWEVLC